MIPLMISYAIKWETDKLVKRVNDANRTARIEAAKEVAKIARRLIKKRKAPSAPGDLPHGKSGNYRRSIRYHVSKTVAYVGPEHPKGAHAPLLKWGTKKMEPRAVPAEVALETARDSLPRKWRNTL